MKTFNKAPGGLDSAFGELVVEGDKSNKDCHFETGVDPPTHSKVSGFPKSLEPNDSKRSKRCVLSALFFFLGSPSGDPPPTGEGRRHGCTRAYEALSQTAQKLSFSKLFLAQHEWTAGAGELRKCNGAEAS